MNSRGFTLLELLVTLAIIGILSAIAWPGYGAIMQRAQRNEARLALLGIQYAEELHYQNLRAYTDAVSTPNAGGGLGLADRSDGGGYALTVSTSEDGQHYVAQARPIVGGRQSGDRTCALLLIDETGRRTAADTAGRDTSSLCWR